MAQSSLYLLADKALDGQLSERLRLWAEAGVSRRAAARLLAHELGVEVNQETIGRWLKAVR